ncbi:MAG: glutathione S-transferase N-terminal domain-containing protein, partial [Hyphomicrobiaceae bacterium]
MLILHTFGPAFGLPDPSPFCMKAMALLRLSGLEHRCAPGDPRKAPKGKLPYLVDGDDIIPDTTFIRWHLEQKHGVTFDAHLTEEQKA